jgi:hypothetical protein
MARHYPLDAEVTIALDRHAPYPQFGFVSMTGRDDEGTLFEASIPVARADALCEAIAAGERPLFTAPRKALVWSMTNADTLTPFADR